LTGGYKGLYDPGPDHQLLGGVAVADHMFLVLTNPAEGLEDEYNDWYTNLHLDEVVAVPGFVSARRYGLSDDQLGGFGSSKHRYLAIYEIAGAPVDAFQALHDELDSGRMVLPEALRRDDINPWCYTPISATVHTKRKAVEGAAAG
jgi:hypothetical protein